MGMFRAFLRNEAGATAMEYGLVMVLITFTILTAVTTVGTSLNSSFNRMAVRFGS